MLHNFHAICPIFYHQRNIPDSAGDFHVREVGIIDGNGRFICYW